MWRVIPLGYARNGFFYVNCTDPNGDSRIERCTVSQDPHPAERASAKPILSIPLPYPIHNAGLVVFAPDGMLGTGRVGGGGAHVASHDGRVFRVVPATRRQ